jgi:hypothetical protein
MAVFRPSELAVLLNRESLTANFYYFKAAYAGEDWRMSKERPEGRGRVALLFLIDSQGPPSVIAGELAAVGGVLKVIG